MQIFDYFAATEQLNEILTILKFPFMQRAMIGAILMGILGGILGCFVTLRKLSFFSHAVGHAALVGIVLGVLLQINPTWMLLPFTLLFGAIVLYFSDTTDLGSDNILSIVLSGALGIGLILSSQIRGYRGNLMSVLFGDILAIDSLDLTLTFLILIVTIVFLFSTLRSQILLTLNSAIAKAQGVPVQIYRYSFVILLSLAVAVAIKAVGILLVNAFLVIPASIAKLTTHHFNYFLVISAIVGCITSVMGILVSVSFQVASGPSIVVVQFVIFLIIFACIKFISKTA